MATRRRAPPQTTNLRRTSIDNAERTNEQFLQIMDEIRNSRAEVTQEIREVREEMRADLKRETSLIRQDLNKIDRDLRKITDKVEKLEATTQKLEKEVKETANIQQEDQETILKIELKQRETCLKLRGVPEQQNENLYEFLSPHLAKYLDIPLSKMEWEIDRMYRLNSKMAKTKQLPRDIVIYWVKKKSRDLMLQKNFKTKLVIEGNEIQIYKDIPTKILKRRKDYKFLTDQLKHYRIPYRWEEIEGITLSWKQKRYKLNSIQKAEDFWKKYRNEIEKTNRRSPEPDDQDSEEKEDQEKRWLEFQKRLDRDEKEREEKKKKKKHKKLENEDNEEEEELEETEEDNVLLGATGGKQPGEEESREEEEDKDSFIEEEEENN